MTTDALVQRPNILWISTHDISPHLGTYSGVWPGAEDAYTPNLDRLAAEGARFDNAFAAAPVCAPSRSAIFTGMYPITAGTMHMRSRAVPPADVTVFSEYLRAAGYYATNNWFTDLQFQTPPTAFDDCSPSAHWRNRPTPDTPFFAAFHGMDTHEAKIHLPDDEFEQLVSDVPQHLRRDPAAIALPPYYPDTPTYRKNWARYLDLITHMDIWVGGILAELENDGLADNTIVVFWSDHGVGMPRGKRWAYDSGLREPLLVRWPGRVAPGQHRQEIIQLMDLTPTMLSVAGVPVPSHVQASTFLDAEGSVLDPNEFAFGSRDRMDDAPDRTRTVRSRNFRYIRNYHPDRPAMQHIQYAETLSSYSEIRTLRMYETVAYALGQPPAILTPLQRSILIPGRAEEELYDLVDDPHETINLAGSADHEDILREHRAALDDWLARAGDLGEVPEQSLIDTWRPEGRLQKTAAPEVSEKGGMITVQCSTAGASIGWTDDPASDDAPASIEEAVVGQPVRDGRHWHLYTGGLPVSSTSRWFGAWRLGFEGSDLIEVAGTAEK